MYACNYSNNNVLYYLVINTDEIITTTKDKQLHKFLDIVYTKDDPMPSLVENKDDEESKLLLRCHINTYVKIRCNDNYIYNFNSYNLDNTLYHEDILVHDFNDYLKKYHDMDRVRCKNISPCVLEPCYNQDELFSDFLIKYQYSYESSITVRVNKDLLLYELTTKTVEKLCKKYDEIVEEYSNKFSSLMATIYFDNHNTVYFNTITELTLNHKYRLMRLITPDRYQYMLFDFKRLPTKIIVAQNNDYVYFTTLYAY